MEYLETEISKKLYKIMELSEELNRDLTFKWDFSAYQRNTIETHREHIQEFNGNKFIKLNINLKDEADQYGKDVSISVDTWQPEEKKESSNDLPF